MFEQQIEAPIYVNREVYVMTRSGSYKKQQRFEVTSQISCIFLVMKSRLILTTLSKSIFALLLTNLDTVNF